MNTLVFSELFYPHGGGAELATYLYTKLLRKAEFDVVVVTNRFAGEAEVSKNGNLIVYRLPLFKKTGSVKYSTLKRFDVVFSSFMRKMVKWADIVYIPGFWYSAILLAKAYGKRVITHLHDYITICPLAVLYDVSKNTICHHRNKRICSPKCIMAHERADSRNLKEALMSVTLNSVVWHHIGKLVVLSDSIICVSEAQKRLIIEHAPSLARRLHVIYNPLPEVTEFNGLGHDFGYFGGFGFLKGFNVLCQALRNVNPKIKVHATKVPNVSKTLSNKLRQLGIIAHRKLSRELYNSLYKRIQVVVIPSIWPEPLPYVVSEALLSKRLIIASRVGGIQEQTKGLKGAFLFEPGNPVQLAELIKYVKDLPKEVKADLGSENKESFLKKNNNVRAFRDFLGILEEQSLDDPYLSGRPPMHAL